MMPLLYDYEQDSVEDILKILAKNLQKRRLEKGLSRNALSMMSGVPAPTIARFEQKYTISLSSFVALAKSMGYADDIKKLLANPLYSTMEELELINKNQNRKKGRNEFSR